MSETQTTTKELTAIEKAEKKVKETQVLSQLSGIEQIERQNLGIDRSIERQRVLPKVVSGERILRTRLTYDDGIQTILSRRERRNNQIFLAKFHWPLDGQGGVGNQQPLPFEVGLPADNSLLDLQRNTDALRYGGATFDTGAFVKKDVYPSERMNELYHVSLIRKTPIDQAWIPKNVSAVGPGGNFIWKRTNDLNPPFINRESLDNRLLFQTFVDGKWT